MSIPHNLTKRNAYLLQWSLVAVFSLHLLMASASGSEAVFKSEKYLYWTWFRELLNKPEIRSIEVLFQETCKLEINASYKKYYSSKECISDFTTIDQVVKEQVENSKSSLSMEVALGQIESEEAITWKVPFKGLHLQDRRYTITTTYENYREYLQHWGNHIWVCIYTDKAGIIIGYSKF